MQGHSFIVLEREREREIVVCQSERQDQHECQTVAESIKTSPLSLYLWARSMAPYGIIPASPDPLSTSRHLLQLLLVRPQLICSRIIMVCPSQVPTLVEYIFFFRYWFIFALSWFSSAQGAGAGRSWEHDYAWRTPAALRQCKTSSWTTTHGHGTRNTTLASSAESLQKW